MTKDIADAPETLAFACPHCAGPLHVEIAGVVACEREHRFSISEVLLEQARLSSQATWLAVRALQQRATAARWAANDPDLHGLTDPAELAATATDDETTAAQLQRQAQALDLTIWRLDRAVPNATESRSDTHA